MKLLFFPFRRYINELTGAAKNELESSPRPVNKRVLKRLEKLVEKAESLPKEYFIEFEKVAKKHAYIFKRMGYNTSEDLLKEPWLLKFYNWSKVASKAEGQKRSLGGKMLEKLVENDDELHKCLLRFTQWRHKVLSDPNFFPLLKFADGISIDAGEFVPVKLTQLVSATKDYLDFAYILYHQKAGKAVVLIKGQVKREGAVGNYFEQARNDTKRLFSSGFSCFIDGEKVSFRPEDIILDETAGPNVLVRSSAPIVIGSKSFTDVTPVFNKYIRARELAAINETYYEFSTAPSTQLIDNMLEDLFKAKMNLIKR